MRLRIIELPREQTLLVFDQLTTEQEEGVILTGIAQQISDTLMGSCAVFVADELALDHLELGQ